MEGGAYIVVPHNGVRVYMTERAASASEKVHDDITSYCGDIKTYATRFKFLYGGGGGSYKGGNTNAYR